MTNKPVIEFDQVSFTFPEGEKPVFTSLSTALPGGMVSFVGQNGTGKSTMLLLAGGRLLPDSGNVTLLGKNTRDLNDEETRNQLASIIYQNLEFENEEPVAELLDMVYENGLHTETSNTLLKDVMNAFELGPVLARKTQELSKGEMQRTIMAFSLLYGSPVILMDEPIFALEDRQKHTALGFIREYSKTTGTNIYFSVHELDLSRKYSDSVLLFYKDGTVQLGAPEVMLDRDHLETAYQIPFGLLHQKEMLQQKHMLERLAVEEGRIKD